MLGDAPGTIFSADSAILSIKEGKLLGVAIAFNGGKYRERIKQEDLYGKKC